MSSEREPLIPQCPHQAQEDPDHQYEPSRPGDSRSPCPLLNALANHNYLPRDGKDISGDVFVAGLAQAGIASTLAAIMARPIYVEYKDPKLAYLAPSQNVFQKLWWYIKNPWAIILGGYGLWDSTKEPMKDGKRVMDLDRLALHGVAEHDISMTRRDTAQRPGANDRQFDLIDELLGMAENGCITIDHMVAFRKKRIQQQLDDNTGLYYGTWEHQTACSNIALILNAFGNGREVRVDVLRALLRDERLPIKEGWKRRKWWKLGAIKLVTAAREIRKRIGLDIF